MPRTLTDRQKKAYYIARDDGFSMRESIIKPNVNISLSSARVLEKVRKTKDMREREALKEGRLEEQLPFPKLYDKLGANAQRAFHEFDFFQRHYLGRVSQPWQVEAAEKVVELLSTPRQEFLVVNCPPGAGKTTLLTHDIVCWLIIRDRSIRCLSGSATQQLANRNVSRVRRTLERPSIFPPDDKLIRQGLAVRPEGILTVDFGRFKPLERAFWTQSGFTVMQPDAATTVEKEPTLSAYGMDAGYIGGRFDFTGWDDLVDPKKMRSAEARENLERDWTDVAENRLEPQGLLALIGQRLSADDLYRFCLDMKSGAEDDWDDDDPDAPGVIDGDRAGMKYHHIKFMAHYEDRCTAENHQRSAPSYPQGCLLSSWRLPWRQLKPIMTNAAARFEVIYQQADVADSEMLVPKNWIYGDSSHYGCLDKDRDILEVPKGLSGLFSVVTVDPSPTQMWGIEHWLWHPESQQRFLFNLENKKMDAADLLDYNHNQGCFYGLMEEWQTESRRLGVPISHWIVEINAAQRYLLGADVTRRWIALNNVEVIPHSTGRNKLDDQLGLWSIKHHYEFGRVRLPYRQSSEGRARSMRLINELVRYPDGRTDDLVMAHWFFEWNLPRIYSPRRAAVTQDRPSWLRDEVA
jgi:hypothetical protein